MFFAFEILGTLHCLVCVLITAYGALKRSRRMLLFGLCFFNISPIIGESLAYAQSDNLVHLLIILFFIVQVVITLPIGMKYGFDNTAAIALSTKIGLAILVANLCQGSLILGKVLEVPIQFGYFHLSIVLILLYVYNQLQKRKCQLAVIYKSIIKI